MIALVIAIYGLCIVEKKIMCARFLKEMLTFVALYLSILAPLHPLSSKLTENILILTELILTEIYSNMQENRSKSFIKIK